MFDFYLIGTGHKREDLPYALSDCGNWLLETQKKLLIDLKKGVVAYEPSDLEELFAVAETGTNKVKLLSSNAEAFHEHDVDLITGERRHKTISREHYRRPDSWVHNGNTYSEKAYISNESAEDQDGHIVYSGDGKHLLVDTKSHQLIADLSEPISQLLTGTKAAESILRSGNIKLTRRDESTQVDAHKLAGGYRQGPHFYLSFKQNSFYWTGVQGALWLVSYNLQTKEHQIIVESVEEMTEPENTVSILEVRSNGSILFTTNGSYTFKDLFLYSPTNGLVQLLGKKDRFRGCQRCHIIPNESEIRLIHHSKSDTHMICFDNDGNLVSKDVMDIPYSKTFTKEDWLSPVNRMGDFWYFNETKEGGLAIHVDSWEAVKYTAPKFENLEMSPTGWFRAIFRNKYYIGYLAVDPLPNAFSKTCKLLGKKSKLANQAKKVAKGDSRNTFLNELNSIGYFDGYPAKLKEKLEGKVIKNKKSHIIEKLEITGIILDDDYKDQGRLSCLRNGNAYGAERVIYDIPACDAHSCDVERKRNTLHVWYKRGAKEFKFDNLDASQFIPELLSFINFVMPVRKMTAKAYFVQKDKKATILCTQAKAMEYLRDKYDLKVTEASRSLKA